MKNIKKLITWILVVTMLTGSFVPAQDVVASNNPIQTMESEGDNVDGNTPGETTPGDGTNDGNTSEEGTLGNDTTDGETSEEPPAEQPPAEEPPTEQPPTEQPPVEEPPTENPSTEQPTPEQPTQIDETVYMLSQISPLTSKVIVIDPGHCKKHPGASRNGLREEDVVYDIATACQDELNNYGDVTVYMTRDKTGCCVELGLGECLISRNNYAKMLNADFLVSMHINAGSSSGANVLAAYKSGYHDNIRKETQAFGKIALQKLKNLGITNRGFLLRKSESGNRYVNGKLADYYSIVRNGVIQNIPSVIIEHGYVTSVSDCNKFFKTAEKRKKVGKADADAIISYYGLNQSVINGSFKKQDGATYFIAKDGRKVIGWVKSGGEWYYFDEQGKMVTGFLDLGGNIFYLHPTKGTMVTGQFKVGSDYYLAKGNGTLAKNEVYGDGVHTYLFQDNCKQFTKGFRTLNGATYYVNNKRYVVTGVQKVGGKYYLFDSESGQMLYGFQKQKGKYYYLDPETGVMARNIIVTINKQRYYFASNGVRKTGLITYKGSKYYFNPKNGKMLTGWRKINKNYYYFDKKTGKMQKNKWIGNYYVNAKGIRTKKK